MSEISLYNLFKRIPDATDTEIKEAIADVASSKDVATKADITRLEIELKYMRWVLGLIFVMNVAILIKLFF